MKRAPARDTSPTTTAPHRMKRRESRACSPTRRRFSDSLGETLPERGERSPLGISWSAAGRNVREVTVRQRTPTTANRPRSQIAVIRFTMSEPKPITLVAAETVSGSHTRAKARGTRSPGGTPAPTCS